MEITLKRVTIREVAENYVDNDEEGVLGYNNLLDIRPPYQREFVYKPLQRDMVIDSIKKGLPLNTMYWNKKSDGTYEVMDGQQRTISFCEYVIGKFPYNHQFFHNLTEDEQEEFLDYELMVYVTEGTEKQKLDWFRTINIAGEKLTPQELRNAVYSGPWTANAKTYFSKTGCRAFQIGKDYLRGTPIRQDYLETVIKWYKDEDDSIEEFMAANQQKEDANEIWQYYRRVINWVEGLFPNYRREMKGLPWGILYNRYRDESYNANELERKVKDLMEDVDVTSKSGIYLYLFDNNEKHLNIRAFDKRQRREAYEEQNGICAICGEEFEIEDMEADHITPWSEGGKTIKENCQMLCRKCNREKAAN